MKIATGFMAAQQLFAASEIGLFEALADGPVGLEARVCAARPSSETACWATTLYGPCEPLAARRHQSTARARADRTLAKTNPNPAW